MVNPQKEHGYTIIANETIDALARTRIPGEEMQCLWVIFRKTYGWNKKDDKIALSQFAKITGLKRPTVARALKKLLTKKITRVDKNDNSQVNSYCFNKHYEQWELLSKKIPVIKNDNRSVDKKDNRVLTKMIHTKDTLTKDTIQKKVMFENFEKIWERYPRREGKKEAERHFLVTVKTDQDWESIKWALENYKEYLKTDKIDNKFIKMGSTWFNNWQDWLNYTEDICPKCKGKGKYISSTGYEVICTCPKGLTVRK